MRHAFVCLLLSAVVSGQGSPSFEVASIRPSSELDSLKSPLAVIVVDAISKAPTEN